MTPIDTHSRQPSTRRLPVVLLCAVAALLIVAAPSARAATFSETFCLAGSAAGQCEAPGGVAVDPSGGPGGAGGTVYLADVSNGRVDAFDTAGHFLGAFGTGVLDGANELQTCTTVCGRGSIGGFHPVSVAVDPASHAIYAATFDTAQNVTVEKFAFSPVTQRFEPLLTFGGGGEADLDQGQVPPLAVDPATHHVWVGGTDVIRQFGEDGEFISKVKLPARGVVRSLAVASAGELFVVTDPNIVQEVDPPAAGNYTLTVHGETTTALSAEPGSEATAAEVEAALAAAFSFYAMRVEGPKGGPFLVEITNPPAGSIADDPSQEITASAGTVTVSQEGGRAAQVEKLGPAGELLGTLDSGGHPVSLSLDRASGAVYVGDCESREAGALCLTTYTLRRYDASGAQTTAWGGGEVIGHPYGNSIGFAAQHLYTVSDEAGPESAAQIFSLPPAGPLVESGSTEVTAVRPATATLNARVNPEGNSTEYRFQYISSARFGQNESEGHEGFLGAEETPLAGPIGEDFEIHAATAALTGLEPGTAYRFRVVAFNSAAPSGNPGETASFTTLLPAEIDASAAQVSAVSATLLADINPLGEASAYHFEYLTEAEFRSDGESFSGLYAAKAMPVPDAPVGAGETAAAVSQQLQGLAPDTTYRYRVVVTNAVAPNGFASSTHAFTTQVAAAALLPDSRQWELVSPPDKHGALLLPIAQEGLIQAAASGEAITYVANAPTEAEPEGFGNGVQVLAARGPGGWSSRDLSPSHPSETGEATSSGLEYRFFSEDLSQGVLQPWGSFEPDLSPEAVEQGPFLRSSFSSSGPCTTACFRPLLIAENVTSGKPFGEEGRCPSVNQLCGPNFHGASSDAEHVVLESHVGLTAEATPPAPGIYEWSAGSTPTASLRLVSVLPGGGVPAVARVFGSGGQGERSARGAIDADGSRVVWSEQPGHLYLRDDATAAPSAVSGTAVDGSQCTEAGKACTIELDAVQGGSGGGAVTPVFQFASSDGSRVFFTDTQVLTADSGAGPGAPDLYEYDLGKPAGQRLTDLTPTVGGLGSHALGLIPGASADGSYVYFVADGVLASNQGADGSSAQFGNCFLNGGGGGVGGTCNLYLRHDGVTSFIARLSGDDYPDWGPVELNLSKLLSRVSPNGRWLAFMSDRSLTGYENRDAKSGRPDEEVYLYHAAASPSEEGKLVCASCNPTGARPRAVEYGNEETGENMPLAGGVRVWEANPEQWIAGNLPGMTAYSNSLALYQSRFLSDQGRLFFNSRDALSPDDTNGTEDVYEYEPPQGAEAPPADTCTASSPEYVPSSSGCVSLISSGTSPEESAFLDASESGLDVFFLTNSRLDPLADTDAARDIYDAHSCSAASPCPPAPPIAKPSCEGDACQQPATPPDDPTPGSLSFSGAGNVLECPKGKVAKNGKCVKQQTKKHKKKKGKKHHKKSKNKKRTAGKNHGGKK